MHFARLNVIYNKLYNAVSFDVLKIVKMLKKIITVLYDFEIYGKELIPVGNSVFILCGGTTKIFAREAKHLFNCFR